MNFNMRAKYESKTNLININSYWKNKVRKQMGR